MPVACFAVQMRLFHARRWAALKLIKSMVPDLTGGHAVVIGSSNIVGKPMAALLLEERATVTQTHIHTRDTKFICREADILVSAVGQPGLVRGDWIKPRAIVIDVGTTRVARSDGGYDVRGDGALLRRRCRLLAPLRLYQEGLVQ